MKNEKSGNGITGYPSTVDGTVDDTGDYRAGKILEMPLSLLSDLAEEESPDAKYIIPFLSVYADPNNASQSL